MNKRHLFALLLVLVAIGFGGKVSSAKNDNNILNLIEQKQIVVNSVIADGGLKLTGFNGKLSGHEIFTVRLTNPGESKISIIIPCGLAFKPKHDDFIKQPMMVIKAVRAELLPGQTVTLEVYVVCIDAMVDLPVNGDEYVFSHMVTGKLKELVDCICEELATDILKEYLGVQYTVWSITNPDMQNGGMSGEEALAEIEKTLKNDKLPEHLKAQMEESLNTVDLMFNAPKRWFERCNMKK